MTQNQFNKKFTKTAFIKFLGGLKDNHPDLVVDSSDSCFFGLFAKEIFNTQDVKVDWNIIKINNRELGYPAWAVKYLNYLRKIMSIDSQEFANLAKKASIEYLS